MLLPPKYLIILFLFLALVLTSYAQDYRAKKITLDGTRLTNMHRIDSVLYRSDQPSRKDFAALEKYGIREVLNLRYRHNDIREASGTSIRLHHLRTQAHRISIAEITEALRIIKNSRGPILVHCWHGSDRTGAVVAMYRIVFHGIPKEQAIDELKNGGFGYHKIFGNIIRTIEEADIGKIKTELGMAD